MAAYIHDLYTNVIAGNSLPPAARTASGNGVGVDLKDADGECFVAVSNGTITDGTHTVTIEESTNDSSYSAVTLLNSLTPLTSATATTPGVQFAAFVRTARYVRAVATVSTATTGGVYGVFIGEQRKFVAQDQP